MGLQSVALSRANDEKMPHRLSALMNDWQNEIWEGELFHVVIGESTAAFVPNIEVPQFHSQDCRLQAVEATINAFHLVRVLLQPAVVCQHPDPLDQLFVLTDRSEER